jgi:phosphatidylglycerophosphatase A
MSNVQERLIKLMATGFGSGYAPFAPGTAGTLAGIPIFFIFSLLPWPWYFLLLALFSAAAVYIAQAAEKIFAKKDAPAIVIDEIIGFLWTMFYVSPTPTVVLGGFLLFRFFDIAKPFPVRSIQDKLPGGYGIVGDDVMAGIYSNLVLQILAKYFYI